MSNRSNLDLQSRNSLNDLDEKMLGKKVFTIKKNSKSKETTSQKFDFDKVYLALERVKNYDNFEFSDQKFLIENIISLIAENILKFDSLGFKRICSQVRMLLGKEKIKYISKKESKVTISFPEREVYITKTEFNKLKKYKDKEDILRGILGVGEQEKNIVKNCEDFPLKNIDDSPLKNCEDFPLKNCDDSPLKKYEDFPGKNCDDFPGKFQDKFIEKIDEISEFKEKLLNQEKNSFPQKQNCQNNLKNIDVKTNENYKYNNIINNNTNQNLNHNNNYINSYEEKNLNHTLNLNFNTNKDNLDNTNGNVFHDNKNGFQDNKNGFYENEKKNILLNFNNNNKIFNNSILGMPIQTEKEKNDFLIHQNLIQSHNQNVSNNLLFNLMNGNNSYSNHQYPINNYSINIDLNQNINNLENYIYKKNLLNKTFNEKQNQMDKCNNSKRM